METKITFNVNGAEKTVATEPERPLLDVLREDLGLTGTKYGCGQGRCGTCTVLLDGTPTRSCTLPISRVAGKSVTTIEGLGTEGKLHPVQAAFMAEGAIQCGFCTPGIVLTAVAFLAKNPRPSDAEIAAGLDGNLCRCCNYIKIVNAVRRAAKEMQA